MKANPSSFPAAALGLAFLAPLCARAQSPFYTDTGSPSNPSWSVIEQGLNNASADPGPVPGSVINVNNAATEVGLYGNRTISVGTQRIHVCCNTSTSNFNDFTRWFQTDGNTQVFRLFLNDQNTASSRVGAARCEAFQIERWKYADGVTYEWTGRFTIARRQEGYAIFQVMNEHNEWALQLNITGSGGLLVNNRRNAPDVLIKNPDGSTKNFDGTGFDVRVIDDGRNYKCWIDGALVAENFYDRPTGGTNFRWGKYMGDNFLTSPSTNSVILVSGAQVKSWRGRLDTATTDRVKANNSQFLGNTASWVGGVLPGIRNRAVWNSTVTATNATTFNIGQTWGGIRITNPGGNVTINGDALLKLEDEGLDMGSSTRNLTVNCPVEPNVTAPWIIASGRAATFNNAIRGYQGITLGGSGRLVLNAANTYRGPTTVNGGTFQLGNGGTTGALHTGSAISVAGGATFEVSRSDSVTQGTHFGAAPISGAGGLRKSGTGTLTLTAANSYTGPTTVNQGTLRLGNGGSTGTLAAASAISVASGATFMVNRSGSVSQGSAFSGAPISGAGAFEKAGSGQLTLTASNTYTGPTRISAGILQLGNGGTTGTLSTGSVIAISSGATFSVNRSDTVTQGTHFSGAAITGGGGLTKSGAGKLTLNAANGYTGPTVINAGILQVGDGGTLGTLGNNSNVSIAAGSQLRIERSASDFGYAYAGALSGSGTVSIPSGRRMNFNTVNQTASGNLSFSVEGVLGVTTSSGVTAVHLGGLSGNGIIQRAGGAGGAAILTVGGKGTDSAFAGSISAAEFGLAKAGGGTLVLTGNNTYAGNTLVSAGTLQLGDGGTTGRLDGTGGITNHSMIAINRGNDFSQAVDLNNRAIAGTGGLTKSGAGTAILTETNTYTGETRITEGVLQIGNGGTSGSLSPGSPITVGGGAAFAINRSDDVAQGTHLGSAAIAGAGGLAKSGAGTLTLIAANSYSGPTLIQAGTLQLGDGGTAGALNPAGSITVADGATFATNRADDVAQGTHFGSGAITGAGGLTKSGSGRLTLTAANTYSGPTRVNAGTLAFANTSPLGNTASITMAGGTMLQPTLGGVAIAKPIVIGDAGTVASISAPTDLPGAGMVSALTLDGAISGAGNVTFTSGANQNALSTVILNAANHYLGETLIDTDGTANTQIVVRLGVADALPTGTVLVIDGKPGDGTGRFADLNLNGFGQRLAGLANIPRALRFQRIVNSDVSAPATLTIENGGDFAFSGSLGGAATGSVSPLAMAGSTGGDNFALAKGGEGSLSLTGTISYSGATVIKLGTLSLGSPNPNNDLSALTIAETGATLNLAFTGTDTVHALFIGDKLMPAGVYKAVGGPGPGTGIPQITGTGTLTVTTGSAPAPTAYEMWKTANGTDQPIHGDHDGDGVPNGVEHFLGGETNTTGFTRLPEIVSEKETLSITWTKGSTYSGSYGTHFTVETSSNMNGVWTTETTAPAPAATVTFPTDGTVKYTFPASSAHKRFVRLKVVEP